MPSQTPSAPEATEPAPRPSLGTRVARATVRNWPLIAIAVAGLVLRLLFVTVWWPTCDYDVSIWSAGGVTLEQGLDKVKNPDRECFDVASGDSTFYFGQGRMIADGEGLGSPFSYLINGEYQPSAAHPPGYSTFLATANLVGLDHGQQQRGLDLPRSGRRVPDRSCRTAPGRPSRSGVIAASLAAVYPFLWINDLVLMSEALYIPPSPPCRFAVAFSGIARACGPPLLLGLAIGAAQLVRRDGHGRMDHGAVPGVGMRASAEGNGVAEAWALAVVTACGGGQRPGRCGTSRASNGRWCSARPASASSCFQRQLRRCVLRRRDARAVELRASRTTQRHSFILSAIAWAPATTSRWSTTRPGEKAPLVHCREPGTYPGGHGRPHWPDLGSVQPGQNTDVDVFWRCPRGLDRGARSRTSAMRLFAVRLVMLRKRRLPISPFIAIFIMT
ncbi:MAG: hypothetical protein R2690_19605 [Acidimicrobiales bacterium]